MKHKTLIENTFPLHLLLRYKSSKPLPIAVGTHLQREGVLTICTFIVNAMGRGSEKPFFAKFAKKSPLNGLQIMPEGWKMVL